MAQSKQDRELIEFLNELRVVLPGVQVMFAFLLTVPFTQYFPKVTPTQKTVYFSALLLTALASALLIAPTSFHRIRWRDKDKEAILQTSNKLAIAGTACVGLAIVAVLWLITDVVYGSPWTAIVTVVAVVVFGGLWYAIPLFREFKD